MIEHQEGDPLEYANVALIYHADEHRFRLATHKIHSRMITFSITRMNDTVCSSIFEVMSNSEQFDHRR
jgi:hypothetical protein